MKLIKRDVSYIHGLTPEAALKGACLCLPGALHIVPEQVELPKELTATLPAVILCRGCDFYASRLLNERGTAVVTPLDPVDSIPDGADVGIDLAAGVLTESATGRRFALRPLNLAHTQEIRADA
jgi:hypothetical protein